MDKIIHSSKNITPFGGLNFIHQAMKRMGLDKFLNQQIADLEQLQKNYSNKVFNKIPSPDTVEYVCQELPFC